MRAGVEQRAVHSHTVGSVAALDEEGLRHGARQLLDMDGELDAQACAALGTVLRVERAAEALREGQKLQERHQREDRREDQ